MNNTIDYYTYKYAVFRGLTDVFKEITITLSTDTYYVYQTIRDENYKLCQKKVCKFDRDKTITVNLINDFKVVIDEGILTDAFNANIPIETTTQKVIDIVKSEWLDQICK